MLIGFNLLNKMWLYALLSAFVLYILWRVYRAGQNKEEVDALKNTLEAVINRQEIEHEVDGLDRSAILEQLRRGGWIRK